MIFSKKFYIFYVLPGSIPDPFHGFMKWIRILLNEVDPGGSGFKTLLLGDYFNVMGFPVHRFCVNLVDILAKQAACDKS